MTKRQEGDAVKDKTGMPCPCNGCDGFYIDAGIMLGEEELLRCCFCGAITERWEEDERE